MGILNRKVGPGLARTPEREALALTRNTLIGVARTAATAKNVLSRAQSLHDQAAARHAAADEAARSSREGHAAAMLASARSGEAVATAATQRELRHAANDASDDLEAAKVALMTAQTEFDEAFEAAARAKRAVAAAADEVMATALPEHLDDIHRQFELLFQRSAGLDFLRRLSSGSHDHRRRATTSIENMRVLLQNTHGLFVEYPDRTAWEAARAALLDDPDAPLPPIGA